jgi:hypothetical protein
LLIQSKISGGEGPDGRKRVKKPKQKVVEGDKRKITDYNKWQKFDDVSIVMNNTLKSLFRMVLMRNGLTKLRKKSKKD